VAGLVNAIMAAIWADDWDPADPQVLTALARKFPWDGADLLEEAATENVRAEYHGNTQRALAAGVFGSPFYAYAGELFWGQDRLDMLEEHIIRTRGGELGRRPPHQG
jgi:2-hydroxychromene-2-carboxylate isomerase